MKVGRRFTAGGGALALLALLAAGCASPSTLSFRCDPDINDGLLLTIDLVQVNEAEAAQIRQSGDQWFYSELRRQLEPRTRTVAVEGGCNTSVKLTPVKGYDTLAVISDYKSAGNSSGNLVFREKAAWKGKKMEVQVQNAVLTIRGSR